MNLSNALKAVKELKLLSLDLAATGLKNNPEIFTILSESLAEL